MTAQPASDAPDSTGTAPGSRPRRNAAGQDSPDGPVRMLSAEEVAGILGGDITARTVLAYRHEWGLRAVKVGKHVRFRADDLTRWLDQRPDA